MPDNRSKPISMHVIDGNKNRLTKEDIEKRQESEIQLGKKALRCPPYVKTDEIAHKMWRECIRDYKKSNANVTSSDVPAIAEYCITYSELLKLRNLNLYEEFKGKKISLSDFSTLDRMINNKSALLLKLSTPIYRNPGAKIKDIGAPPKKGKTPLEKSGFILK